MTDHCESPPTPKSPYEEGKIYKLICTAEGHEDAVYVGSTFKLLRERMNRHRAASARSWSMKTPVYQLMRAVGKDKFKIELLENYPCQSKAELLEREQYWMTELKPSLNVISAHISKERKAAYNKEWREKQKAMGFPCEVCQQSFTQAGGLKRHLTTKKHLAKVAQAETA